MDTPGSLACCGSYSPQKCVLLSDHSLLISQLFHCPHLQRSCGSATPEPFRHWPSHLHQSMPQPTDHSPSWTPSLVVSSPPPPWFPWPRELWHSGPQSEVTPTAITSSSASTPASENFAQGRCRITENSPFTQFTPVNNGCRALGLPASLPVTSCGFFSRNPTAVELDLLSPQVLSPPNPHVLTRWHFSPFS